MKNLKRILVMTLVLSLMFTVTAFAADTDTTRLTEEERAEQFEAMLSEQVSDGTLTQDEADALIEYLDENEPEKSTDGEKPEDSERPDMFAGAVEAGIITQDQADAISEDVEANAPERPERPETPDKSEDSDPEDRPEKPEGSEAPAGPRGGGGRNQDS